MQCSTKHFLESQALYGIMIAYPNMLEDDQIKKAQRIASKLMKKQQSYAKRRNAKSNS